MKSKIFIILAILAIIIMMFAIADVVSAEPTTPLPLGEEIPDTDNPDWEVTWLNEDGTVQHLTYVGKYPDNLSYGWDGCTVIIETVCIDGATVENPPIGRKCTRIGSRKFNCGSDVQRVRWERNVKKYCNYYIPLESLNVYTPPPVPVCSCDLYNSVVTKNPSIFQFSFPLPAFPQMGYGETLQVYANDTVTHQLTWGGDGGWGADPCLVSADLTVKAKGYPQTTIDCTSGWCSYDCSTMHLTQTESIIQNNVYLENGDICRGRYSAYDPCDPTTHTCIDDPIPYDGS